MSTISAVSSIMSQTMMLRPPPGLPPPPPPATTGTSTSDGDNDSDGFAPSSSQTGRLLDVSA